MSRMIESPLFESVRQWVLRALPIDRSNTALVDHLEDKDAHGLLVVYHNWTSRMISTSPRRVNCSSALGNNPLAIQYQNELTAIIADIEAGRPLTKYLSRGVTIAAALPGNSPALQRRRDLDLMLNNWGIYHLHLSTTVESDGFVSRTKPLLFGVFKNANAYLLDIMEHGSWTSRHLLEVLVREFPKSGGFQIVNGAVGLSYEPDEEQLKKLRNNAINSAIMIEGKVVMPATGMTGAGTTLAATRDSDELLDAIEGFEERWSKEPERLREMVRKAGNELPDIPEFSFEILEEVGPGVFERLTKTFIPLIP